MPRTGSGPPQGHAANISTCYVHCRRNFRTAIASTSSTIKATGNRGAPCVKANIVGFGADVQQHEIDDFKESGRPIATGVSMRSVISPTAFDCVRDKSRTVQRKAA